MPDKASQLKRRVKLRDLDTLMAVASAGGMRKAAEQLHLSQPAVSNAIAALEDALGYTLLDRNRAGTEVTAFGQAMIKRATAMFDELELGTRDMELLADPQAGHINLAGPDTINGGIVAAAMERTLRRSPRITFGLDMADTPMRVSRFLLDRISDFVITRAIGVEIDSEICAEPLFHERMQVVVSSASPWARRRKLKLADLAAEQWILSRNEHMVDSPVAKAFRDAEVPFPTSHVLSGSLNVRYTLLETGRFVTVMPRSLLRFGAARSFLKVLPIDMGQWAVPTMILTLAGRSINPAGFAFLDTVRDLARELGDS